MVSICDALADFPIEVRKKLFENHEKPFGARVHNKMHMGKKHEHKYHSYFDPSKYENKSKARDGLGPRPRNTI